MITNKQYLGIGIIGLEAALLAEKNDLVAKYDNAFHFSAGAALGLITQNPIIQITAIVGWEVVEPFVYLYLKKLPGIIIPNASDSFKDITITALGAYLSSKYLAK
jgi:hypothetical protein